MRTVLASFVIATVAAIPGAQAQLQRNPLPYPKSLHEDRQPAYDFTQIRASDGSDRGLVVMVSAARPGNRQPYRAIVAWDGAPDHYWSMSFDFDCSSRSMSRVDSEKRRWHRRYKADESFPVADAYRADFSSLVAPVICDGQTGVVSRSSEKAMELAHGFLNPAS